MRGWCVYGARVVRTGLGEWLLLGVGVVAGPGQEAKAGGHELVNVLGG
jgi:hypothetical protein